jgi:hypothetical protein
MKIRSVFAAGGAKKAWHMRAFSVLRT